jgi:site-specific DNA-cytosine methylase
MRIAVLFDGAGLARLGLEQAGHDCVGVELDPWKHWLGQHIGKGNTVCMSATDFNLKGFDAVWASPPCQLFSMARTQGGPKSAYAGDFLSWSLGLKNEVLWVENVVPFGKAGRYGNVYNAGQFTETPIQNRNRIIGGRFIEPRVYRPYKKTFPGVCPCVTATEYKGCASDTRRASRYYGRKLTVRECAERQGLTLPAAWFNKPAGFNGTEAAWTRNLYEAIGNGVPVYMARGFGLSYS